MCGRDTTYIYALVSWLHVSDTASTTIMWFSFLPAIDMCYESLQWSRYYWTTNYFTVEDLQHWRHDPCKLSACDCVFGFEKMKASILPYMKVFSVD